MSAVPRRSFTPTLLVDDDAEQRQLVAELLLQASIAPVFEAGSADEALAVAAEHPDVVLVILDVVMPARSGLDVLPELHDLLPQAGIVVLSNLPPHRVAEPALAGGATGYVEKRVPPERLVTEILMAAAVTTITAERVTAGLPAKSIAARTARGLVREALLSVDQELLESIELLVSELVTNAVLHASSAPRLEVHVNRTNVRVEVFDDDATPPRTRDPGVGSTGGWGLQLVNRIASRWGSEPQAGGKVVWFEMDRV